MCSVVGDLCIYKVKNLVPVRLGKIADDAKIPKTCLQFSSWISSSQQLLVTGNEQGSVMVYDAATRYPVFSKIIHAVDHCCLPVSTLQGAVTGTCFGDRPGRVFCCGLDGKLTGIDLRSSKVPPLLDFEKGFKVDGISLEVGISCLDLHPNGRYLALGTQGVTRRRCGLSDGCRWGGAIERQEEIADANELVPCPPRGASDCCFQHQMAAKD